MHPRIAQFVMLSLRALIEARTTLDETSCPSTHGLSGWGKEPSLKLKNMYVRLCSGYRLCRCRRIFALVAMPSSVDMNVGLPVLRDAAICLALQRLRRSLCDQTSVPRGEVERRQLRSNQGRNTSLCFLLTEALQGPAPAPAYFAFEPPNSVIWYKILQWRSNAI